VATTVAGVGEAVGDGVALGSTGKGSGLGVQALAGNVTWVEGDGVAVALGRAMGSGSDESARVTRHKTTPKTRTRATATQIAAMT
jgi:hypothetical protein